MATPTIAQCHAVINYYIKAYESVYGTTPVVNRNRSKYPIQSLLMDYNKNDVETLLDYYFKLPPGGTENHSLHWFTYNYDAIIKSMGNNAKQNEQKRRLLEESRKRSEQWVNSGQSRTYGN